MSEVGGAVPPAFVLMGQRLPSLLPHYWLETALNYSTYVDLYKSAGFACFMLGGADSPDVVWLQLL